MALNTNMPYEKYKEVVFKELKEYGSFKNPDEEATEYLKSSEVEQRIQDGYKKDDSAETCAWAIDMLY